MVSLERNFDHLAISIIRGIGIYYFMRTYLAEILSIGNEILSGRTVNTNASHIARRLTSLGFTVRRITVVMDELDEISQGFKEAIQRNPKIIISTGGLGPTYDDKTAEGLSLALRRKLTINKKALEEIENKYKKIRIRNYRRKKENGNYA